MPDVDAVDARPLHDKPSLRPKWLLKIAVEVAFITMGVFLALMAEQWRERAHARELAHASLERFRTEIVNNRKAVETERASHAVLRDTALLRMYEEILPKIDRALGGS